MMVFGMVAFIAIVPHRVLYELVEMELLVKVKLAEIVLKMSDDVQIVEMVFLIYHKRLVEIVLKTYELVFLIVEMVSLNEVKLVIMELIAMDMMVFVLLIVSYSTNNVEME